MRDLTTPTRFRPSVTFAVALALALAFSGLLTACGSDGAAHWSGTMDTLSSGEIVVRNTADPIWEPGEAWRVIEDLRIGNAMSDGPDLFGGVYSFDVDGWGRIFVLDDQAQEVRIFDSEGAFVRKVGRRGEGPGEFTRAGSVDVSRDGEIWVMGMVQGRISIFDTAGSYLREERTKVGRMIMRPYRGGFDPMGRYNVVLPSGKRRRMARFDPSFTPIDTIAWPENPVEREYFTMVDEEGASMMTAGVPFQGHMAWRFSPAGTVWRLRTDRYEFAEMTTGGEVLRRVTKDHESIPVTAEEREEAVKDLEWFTSQGGKIDRSKFPKSKPAAASFFIDDEGNLWVQRRVAGSGGDDEGRLFDLFDAEGRYLGTLRLPFSLPRLVPVPIVREGVLHGVTHDELDVPYVVRARIVKP